jgi:hypothetical protein
MSLAERTEAKSATRMMMQMSGVTACLQVIYFIGDLVALLIRVLPPYLPLIMGCCNLSATGGQKQQNRGRRHLGPERGVTWATSLLIEGTEINAALSRSHKA